MSALRLLRSHCVQYHKLYSILFLLGLPFVMTACTTDWINEATSIINLLVPAIEGAIAILAAFGTGLSPDVLTQVQTWGQKATTALQTVILPLLNEYNQAEASAQPGILVEIQNGLQALTDQLNALLPLINVTDPTTRAKIMAVVDTVANELAALVALVPAIEGKVTSHDELKALVSAVKSPKEFKSAYNDAAKPFGEQYMLK